MFCNINKDQLVYSSVRPCQLTDIHGRLGGVQLKPAAKISTQSASEGHVTIVGPHFL